MGWCFGSQRWVETSDLEYYLQMNGYPHFSYRVFPKIGVGPQNGWYYDGKPYSNGWFGGTTIFGNPHIASFSSWVLYHVFVKVEMFSGTSLAGHVHFRFLYLRSNFSGGSMKERDDTTHCRNSKKKNAAPSRGQNTSNAYRMTLTWVRWVNVCLFLSFAGNHLVEGEKKWLFRGLQSHVPSIYSQ